MADIETLKLRVQQLAERAWDVPVLEAGVKKLTKEGIPRKTLNEHVVFGRNMDPGASQANMAAFAEAKGFQKCGLAAGIGARLAAGFMIDSME